MSFLSLQPPASDSEASSAPRSAAEASAGIERMLASRAAAPDLQPVLAAIAEAASALLRQPRVAEDAETRHILRLMAFAEDMERFDALAGALRARLTHVPSDPPARPGPPAGRFLLRL